MSEKNECLSCDCWDSDLGCTMPSLDKSYACHISSKVVSIDILGLPEKIVRLLGRNGMKTANDLFAHLNKDYLLSLRGMGRKGLDEIEKGIFRLMESDKELFKYLDNLPRVYMHEPEYIYRRLRSRKSAN